MNDETADAMVRAFVEHTERAIEQLPEGSDDLHATVLSDGVLKGVRATFQKKHSECQEVQEYRHATLVLRTGLTPPSPEITVLEVGVAPSLDSFERVYRNLNSNYEDYVTEVFDSIPDTVSDIVDDNLSEGVFGHVVALLEPAMLIASFVRVGSVAFKVLPVEVMERELQ